MKAFNRTTIALCLSLAILFLTIESAAAASANNTTLEIRGPVYDGSGIDNLITQETNDAITMNADKFAAFSYDIDQTVTNNTIKTGTFGFNVTDIGKGTGEGTYNITTGTLKFWGTSTAKGDFTGTYNTNTKEGTITYNTNPLEATSNFTATYDTITNELAINIADPNQLMYYPYVESDLVESDLGEGILVNNTVTEEIEENISQAEPDSSVDVNATVSGL